MSLPTPSPEVAIKLASIAVHADEALSPGGHAYDITTIRALLSDAAAAALFVGTVVAANWALQRFGTVPVGFGLVAPAGVYFAGLAFTLRDIVHRTLGRTAVIASITVGAAVSYYVTDLAPGLASSSVQAEATGVGNEPEPGAKK